MQRVYARTLEVEVARLDDERVGILNTVDGCPLLHDHRHTSIQHLLHLTHEYGGHHVVLPVGLQGIRHHVSLLIAVRATRKAHRLGALLAVESAQGMNYLDEVVVLQGYTACTLGYTRALAHQFALLVIHPVAPLVDEAVVDIALPTLAQVIQSLPRILCARKQL